MATLSVASSITSMAAGRKKLGIRRNSVAKTSPTWSGSGTRPTISTVTPAETLPPPTTTAPTLAQGDQLMGKGTCATDVTMPLWCISPVSPLPDTPMTLSQEMERLEGVMVSAHHVREKMEALTSAWERKRDARGNVSTELAQVRKCRTILEDEIARLQREILQLSEKETQLVEEEDRLRLEEDVLGHEVETKRPRYERLCVGAQKLAQQLAHVPKDPVEKCVND
ncbi:uncharacterized protein LOC112905119 [Agrilus planipennis]|uniref:Uncharacterized protein LOC112905119 n=1 Tax=Agrilus planipennis TaxID=224129 RepID=A0A7F5R9Q8_AGRPL|nr:uncharacterized protein LOC112905119 [Agrilus planipennis]